MASHGIAWQDSKHSTAQHRTSGWALQQKRGCSPHTTSQVTESKLPFRSVCPVGQLDEQLFQKAAQGQVGGENNSMPSVNHQPAVNG